ncbi:hypothetical protein [Trinickia symbiotica]|uniref:Uncharacterized protein n=1 Tax=Trinickia symbiotica TaxID=863227 RepID=A0A2N7X9M1_9BURK|nr:hypothetical protein [Trinickia symbiotica]PMS38456.1 hypothetical protein C0Z20_00795 [Trinickia symbiotica]
MSASTGNQGNAWINAAVPLDMNGGMAGPSNATAFDPTSFTDGSFVVSGSPALGTSIAGAVAGATNSFSFGSLGAMTPYLIVAGLVWFAMRHRK